jgi:anti-sigma factor RsiW
VLGGWQLHTFVTTRSMPTTAESTIPLRAAIAHAVYSPEVRHPVEVGADQESHLVAWLSKRLGAKVRAPNLESAGYSLVGGRLLPGENGPVAQFMYQCKQGTRVTLYVRTGMADQKETAFRYADEGNVRVFYWIDRTYGYAVSSADISKDVLYKVANTAYAQLNP